jgi:Fur family ferric uptake transcriptional regulator
MKKPAEKRTAKNVKPKAVAVTADAAGAAAASGNAARDAYVAFLDASGLRLTRQRLVIFTTAFESQHHYTAEELYAVAKQRDKSVSRATVYRTLPTLVAAGLVREVDTGTDSKYYVSARDKNTFQAQIICPDCDSITEADAPFMEWYGKSLAAKFGSQLVSQRLQVIARCPACVAKKQAANQ